MYYLATIFPPIRKIKIPITRDQAMLLMLALNELLLGFETYSAHIISGTIRPYEWIPILFSPAAGAILIITFLVSLKKRPLGQWMAVAVFLASTVVGFLGSYFHLRRAILPAGATDSVNIIPLFIWAPPALAPLTYCLIGLLGFLSIWHEDPLDSGRLVLFGGKHLQMPFSKSRAFFFTVSMGCLATVVSSVIDHTRTDFSNPWLWLPTALGVFAVIIALITGIFDQPNRGDLIVYTVTMGCMILTGMLGTVLHILHDLTPDNQLVLERFIRMAPVMAPMLFADMGGIGLIVLLDPNETARSIRS